MKNNTNQININKEYLEDKIYEIRGQKVMLDCDLAKIYGYTTKRFNEQVKRNKEKFPSDFMFRLNPEEISFSSRSQIATLNNSNNKRGFNIKFCPFVFTEQGIYMLMTVLKGDLAIKQSKALIRTFKAMKDYIISNQYLLTHNEALDIALQNRDDINRLKDSIPSMATKEDINKINKRISIIDTKFVDDNIKSFIIESNTKFEVNMYFKKLFSKVKESIIIIDNYMSSKTLEYLDYLNKGISVTLITDKNTKLKDKLKEYEYNNYINEHTDLFINIINSDSKIHDRIIIIDYKTDKQKIFILGSSLKDTGNKISTIVQINDIKLNKELISIIENKKEYIW